MDQKDNDSEELAFLYEGNGLKYGHIRIEGKSGKIDNNLLQDNIVIYFESEDEKEQILKLIPDGFYANVFGNKIIIEFKKEEITAPVYKIKIPSGGYFKPYSKANYYSSVEWPVAITILYGNEGIITDWERPVDNKVLRANAQLVQGT